MRGGRVHVIGAGPAGLTAALRLARAGREAVVLEARDRVGGIACTENHGGYHFDMGGHRFFTKYDEVEEVWRDLLGEDLLVRSRLSRIYYGGRFFDYPLKPLNAFLGMNPWNSLLILLSYMHRRLRPHPREENFAQWVSNRFGDRLFRTFFKTYTEKVWGIPCTELRAEWAAQRIRDLSLKTALLSMFRDTGRRVRTLVDRFHYPRRGPGMLWEAARRRVEGQGGQVLLNHPVKRIKRNGNRLTSLVVDAPGGEEEIGVEELISTMPVTELVRRLDPPPPAPVLAAAEGLRFRSFLTVCLIVDRDRLFPDQWIYVHDPEVRMGRIQNYKNWSPHMVPDPGRTGLGLEYFCDRGDELWSMSDADLVALGRDELDRMGLVRSAEVLEGHVFRVPAAYPVYDGGYARRLAVIRNWLAGLAGFQTIGRSGLFRYNNMDHSMVTAFYAVDRLAGRERDVWSVNEEREYHEERTRGDGGEEESRLGEALELVFKRVDRVSLGLSLGIILGLLLLLATLVLVVQGGGPAAPVVGLLAQFLPGYSVSWSGAVIGLAYGLLFGYLLGWFAAFLRNAAVFLPLVLVKSQARRAHMRRFLEYM